MFHDIVKLSRKKNILQNYKIEIWENFKTMNE